MDTNPVSVLLGAQGIRKAYEESLKAKSLDIVCLATGYTQVIGDYFDKQYAPRLYGSVQTREIVPDTQANRDDAKQKDPKVNAVKFLSGSSETDMLLSNDQITLVSYNPKKPLAVVITDPELVKGFRLQFEALWERL